MTRLFRGIALLAALFGSPLLANDEARYRVINTTVNLAGANLPVALMIDSKTGASWYLALANLANQAEKVPTWERIPYSPNLTTVPPSVEEDVE